MTYSQSKSDSNFVVNLVSDFAPTFSESESKSESVFSLSYICIPLNKPADDFFMYFHNRINSYASNASIMHIFFWHIITQKVCFITPSNSLTLAFKYFCS